MTIKGKIAREIMDAILGGATPANLADRILALLAESGWRHVPDDCVVVPRETLSNLLEAAEFGNNEQSPPGHYWTKEIEDTRAMLAVNDAAIRKARKQP